MLSSTYSRFEIEVARDRTDQHPVERQAAADQQHRNPDRGDRDHAPRQRAGDPARQRGGLRRVGVGYDGRNIGLGHGLTLRIVELIA